MKGVQDAVLWSWYKVKGERIYKYSDTPYNNYVRLMSVERDKALPPMADRISLGNLEGSVSF